MEKIEMIRRIKALEKIVQNFFKWEEIIWRTQWFYYDKVKKEMKYYDDIDYNIDPSISEINDLLLKRVFNISASWQVFVNAVQDKIIFNSYSWNDILFEQDIANNNIIIPRTGTYKIIISMNFSNNWNKNITIKKNWATIFTSTINSNTFSLDNNFSFIRSDSIAIFITNNEVTDTSLDNFTFNIIEQ